ncbi:MAG: flagellar biosynthesis anti-sigma factor FlgM [Gallionella sp.]
MKIEKTGNAPPPVLTNDATARTADSTARTANTKTSSTPQQPSTSVSLGSTATQLSKMQTNMSNAPVVDANKVAEIKQAISEGRFQINSGMVADRLIQSVRDLISGQA